jgi:hypothetical protein
MTCHECSRDLMSVAETIPGWPPVCGSARCLNAAMRGREEQQTMDTLEAAPTHPEPDVQRVLGLAAACGLPWALTLSYVDTPEDRAAYARLVDAFDSLAWLTADRVRFHGTEQSVEPFETLTAGAGITVHSPYGFTPASDRLQAEASLAETPTDRLGAATVGEPAEVRSIREAFPDRTSALADRLVQQHGATDGTEAA